MSSHMKDISKEEEECIPLPPGWIRISDANNARSYRDIRSGDEIEEHPYILQASAIARRSIPEGWIIKEVQLTNGNKDIFYCHPRWGISCWDHPHLRQDLADILGSQGHSAASIAIIIPDKIVQAFRNNKDALRERMEKAQAYRMTEINTPRSTTAQDETRLTSILKNKNSPDKSTSGSSGHSKMNWEELSKALEVQMKIDFSEQMNANLDEVAVRTKNVHASTKTANTPGYEASSTQSKSPSMPNPNGILNNMQPEDAKSAELSKKALASVVDFSNSLEGNDREINISIDNNIADMGSDTIYSYDHDGDVIINDDRIDSRDLHLQPSPDYVNPQSSRSLTSIPGDISVDEERDKSRGRMHRTMHSSGSWSRLSGTTINQKLNSNISSNVSINSSSIGPVVTLHEGRGIDEDGSFYDADGIHSGGNNKDNLYNSSGDTRRRQRHRSLFASTTALSATGGRMRTQAQTRTGAFQRLQRSLKALSSSFSSSQDKGGDMTTGDVVTCLEEELDGKNCMVHELLLDLRCALNAEENQPSVLIDATDYDEGGNLLVNISSIENEELLNKSKEEATEIAKIAQHVICMLQRQPQLIVSTVVAAMAHTEDTPAYVALCAMLRLLHPYSNDLGAVSALLLEALRYQATTVDEMLMKLTAEEIKAYSSQGDLHARILFVRSAAAAANWSLFTQPSPVLKSMCEQDTPLSYILKAYGIRADVTSYVACCLKDIKAQIKAIMKSKRGADNEVPFSAILATAQRVIQTLMRVDNILLLPGPISALAQCIFSFGGSDSVHIFLLNYIIIPNMVKLMLYGDCDSVENEYLLGTLGAPKLLAKYYDVNNWWPLADEDDLNSNQNSSNSKRNTQNKSGKKGRITTSIAPPPPDMSPEYSSSAICCWLIWRLYTGAAHVDEDVIRVLTCQEFFQGCPASVTVHDYEVVNDKYLRNILLTLQRDMDNGCDEMLRLPLDKQSSRLLGKERLPPGVQMNESMRKRLLTLATRPRQMTSMLVISQQELAALMSDVGAAMEDLGLNESQPNLRALHRAINEYLVQARADIAYEDQSPVEMMVLRTDPADIMEGKSPTKAGVSKATIRDVLIKNLFVCNGFENTLRRSIDEPDMTFLDVLNSQEPIFDPSHEQITFNEGGAATLDSKYTASSLNKRVPLEDVRRRRLSQSQLSERSPQKQVDLRSKKVTKTIASGGFLTPTESEKRRITPVKQERPSHTKKLNDFKDNLRNQDKDTWKSSINSKKSTYYMIDPLPEEEQVTMPSVMSSSNRNQIAFYHASSSSKNNTGMKLSGQSHSNNTSAFTSLVMNENTGTLPSGVSAAAAAPNPFPVHLMSRLQERQKSHNSDKGGISLQDFHDLPDYESMNGDDDDNHDKNDNNNTNNTNYHENHDNTTSGHYNKRKRRKDNQMDEGSSIHSGGTATTIHEGKLGMSVHSRLQKASATVASVSTTDTNGNNINTDNNDTTSSSHYPTYPNQSKRTNTNGDDGSQPSLVPLSVSPMRRPTYASTDGSHLVDTDMDQTVASAINSVTRTGDNHSVDSSNSQKNERERLLRQSSNSSLHARLRSGSSRASGQNSVASSVVSDSISDDEVESTDFKSNEISDSESVSDTGSAYIPVRKVPVIDRKFALNRNHLRDRLVQGFEAFKHDRKGSKRVRKIRYDIGSHELRWKSLDDVGMIKGTVRGKQMAIKGMKIASVREVRRGVQTPILSRALGEDPSCCVSLISSERTLDLTFASQSLRDEFIRSVQIVFDEKNLSNSVKFL